MAIRIEIANKVKFKVEGTIANEAGAEEKFDFSVTAKRINAEGVRNLIDERGDEPIVDFLVTVIEGWAGVLDAAGQAVAFSESSLRALLTNIPGLAQLVFTRYLREIGAKAKN
jgi:hypothetical protein